MPLRIAHGVMALLFFGAMWREASDPDPLRWMIVYGLAAVAALRIAAGRTAWFLGGAVGSVALGWAFVLGRDVWKAKPPLQALTDWSIRAPGAEGLRELAGLGLVVAWMAVIVVTQRPAARR